MDYIIESGVPLPPKAPREKQASYPFPLMDIGDSFAYRVGEHNRVSSAACLYGKRNGKRFAIRGARVWRVK
jgi:hypothetical protein